MRPTALTDVPELCGSRFKTTLEHVSWASALGSRFSSSRPRLWGSVGRMDSLDW